MKESRRAAIYTPEKKKNIQLPVHAQLHNSQKDFLISLTLLRKTIKSL